MGKIKIENIKSGMIVATDVKDYRGSVLLTAGEKILDKNIKIFKMWGITEVDVRDHNSKDNIDGDKDSLDQTHLIDAKEHVQNLFKHVDLQHPANTELYRLCIKRLAKQEIMEEANG